MVIQVFERMEKVAGSGNEMLSFMSTHPSFKVRFVLGTQMMMVYVSVIDLDHSSDWVNVT